MQEVLAWREDVDEKVGKLLSSEEQMPELFEIAIQHEKQHQELMLMDLQLNFFLMDVQPTAFTGKTSKFMNPDKTFKIFPEAVYEFGCDGPEFSFDNEGPKHKRFS